MMKYTDGRVSRPQLSLSAMSGEGGTLHQYRETRLGRLIFALTQPK